jgi:hypothetical protein
VVVAGRWSLMHVLLIAVATRIRYRPGDVTPENTINST